MHCTLYTPIHCIVFLHCIAFLYPLVIRICSWNCPTMFVLLSLLGLFCFASCRSLDPVSICGQCECNFRSRSVRCEEIPTGPFRTELTLLHVRLEFCDT